MRSDPLLPWWLRSRWASKAECRMRSFADGQLCGFRKRPQLGRLQMGRFEGL